MAVMDAETWKLLNYKQLTSNPKYKKKWAISLVNEFGHLANGVGGRTKKTTNTIEFIRRDEVSKDRIKYVRYGSFVCNIRPEEKEKEIAAFTDLELHKHLLKFFKFYGEELDQYSNFISIRKGGFLHERNLSMEAELQADKNCRSGP